MRFGIGNGSDMIQRSLKTVTQSFSSLKIQAGAQRRSAAGVKVPLRSAAFRPTPLRPIARLILRGMPRLAWHVRLPVPVRHDQRLAPLHPQRLQALRRRAAHPTGTARSSTP